MPKVALKNHPCTPCRFVSEFEVDAEWQIDNLLVLRYSIHGDLSRLLFPASADVRRCDELWKHSCFEAFLKNRNSERYYELNFASSRAWACYRFVSYRNGMSAHTNAKPPEILVRPSPQAFEFEARIDLSDLILSNGPLDLALSAVIETEERTLSYWALTHPPGRPDFHHPDAFILEIHPTARRIGL